MKKIIIGLVIGLMIGGLILVDQLRPYPRIINVDCPSRLYYHINELRGETTICSIDIRISPIKEGKWEISK